MNNTPPVQPGGIPGSVNSPPAPSAPTFDEADFKKRLMDEYKILQEKIDKIGGFRFTIKGWSVTAVIAATAAASASSNLRTVLVISLGLAFMLVFFCRFEFQQVKLSRLFGERARKLEDSFRLLDRGGVRTTSAPIAAPYTAHEVGLASFKQRLLDEQASQGPRKVIRLRKRWVGRWRVLRQADIYFYIVLISLAFVLPLLPRYSTIQIHLKQWLNKTHHSEPSTPRPVGRTTGLPGW